MSDEFHQVLKKFPLIASKNPQLELLNEKEQLQLQIRRSVFYRKIWKKQRKRLARFSVDTKIRNYVEAADRFRDSTRAHTTEAHLPIEWPIFEFSSSAQRLTGPRADTGYSAALRTLHQGKKLQQLCEIISRQIAFSLDRPCPVFEDRYSVRVEFMDCIAWVALKIEQVIKMEVKDSAGDWQLSTLRFDPLKPMQTTSWIDQVLLAWVDDIVISFNEDAESAYDGLHAELCNTYHQESSLQGIRQQVRHYMSVDTGVIGAFLHIKQQAGMRRALMNTEMSELWPVAKFWAELHSKYPDLTLLCYLAGRSKKGPSIRNVDELRSSFLRAGLSAAGWRYLLQQGESSYHAVIGSGLLETSAFPMAIGLIEWQARSGLKAPMPAELATAFLNFAAMGLVAGLNIAETVDPRIARVATKHYLELEAAEDRSDFAEREWLEVLIWMRNLQPEIDKNQWKSGWRCIWRKFLKRTGERDSKAEWESMVSDICFSGMQVTPLTSSRELCVEGMKMKHCVSTYAKECRDGSYRVFSIRDKRSKKRVATAGLKMQDSFWRLDQVKGPDNGPVSTELEALSKSLAQFYQQSYAQSVSRIRHPGEFENATAKAKREGFYHLKVSDAGCLMARNTDGEWALAQGSEYPISPDLRSSFRPGSEIPQEAGSGVRVAELTLRLRLEMPAQFAVYIWDPAKKQDRLLRVDAG